MTNKYYVYLHRKATNGEVFYVGKGEGGRAKATHNRTLWWNRIVDKHGFYIEYPAENLSETDAYALEVKLIGKYGRRELAEGTLVNMTNGGDGTYGLSPEAAKRKSEALTD